MNGRHRYRTIWYITVYEGVSLIKLYDTRYYQSKPKVEAAAVAMRLQYGDTYHLEIVRTTKTWYEVKDAGEQKAQKSSVELEKPRKNYYGYPDSPYDYLQGPGAGRGAPQAGGDQGTPEHGV